MIKKRNKNYERVMSRVHNPSRSSLVSSSIVTRHEIPSSVRVGAKPSISNVSSAVFSELPTVLNDYVPEDNSEKPKKSIVVKPKRTIKSLDPAKSPPRALAKAKELREKSRKIRTQGSLPAVVNHEGDGWSDSHVRQCYSSRSHTRLKELKDEIKAYGETEKLMKLRSHLYKSCGVLIDDVGQVALDKGIQADVTKTGMQLNNDLVLGILNDGNCSELDFDDDDEEFIPLQLENDEEGEVELSSPPRPSVAAEESKNNKGKVSKRKSTSDNMNDSEAGPSCSKKSKQKPCSKVTKKSKAVKVKLPARKRLWKKTNYVDKSHNYSGYPQPNEIRSPVEYYNDNFYERMALCTNLYYLRKTGRVLNTTKQEIKKLIGIHLLMGILSYPRIAMYWRRNIKVDMIVSAMTRDRLTTLRNSLHVVDSDSPPVSEAKNPLWKVQPMIDIVREGCNKILRTPGRYSIDEQMIPFIGKCHLRQLVKNKPRPVGLKNFVVTTSEGLMVDFEIYYGNNPALSHRLGLGPAVVLRLSQSVVRGSCIFFDRYFTTVPLLEELVKMDCHGTGTIMLNRVPDRQNLKFKDDKKMTRGEIEQRVSNDVVLVKWKDSKAVLTASNCTGGTAIDIVKRYNKKEKCYVDVDAPKIVTSYNFFMGGVDVLDQSMEYYRTFMKTRKWTLKVILHFIDLAMVNSWHLYRSDSLAKGIPKNRIQDLLSFRFEVAETLICTPDRDRRDSSPLLETQAQTSGRYKPANHPSVGKRFDGYEHFPVFDNLKAPRKCRSEICSSRSKIRCRKCDVYLCLSRDKDCFFLYHQRN